MTHDDWKWLSIFGLAALVEIGMTLWLIWRDLHDQEQDRPRSKYEDE